MNKGLLYKYFNNKTSEKETREILDWFETSEDNKQTFLMERMIWNTSVLRTEQKESTKKQTIFRRMVWQFASAAAVILVVIGLWQFTGDAPGQQTIFVPVGQRASITLEDGTTVWLNSNTTFTYPTRFNKKKREVSINGEGYFEVARNEKCPFIVSTDKYEVQVLGTTFNVYAYTNYPFEAALLEGAVNIKSKKDQTNILLQPNEMVYEAENELIKKEIPFIGQYKWQNGMLTFNDEPIQNVIKMLSAYYDKKILMEVHGIDDYRCTTKFRYNEGLDYILNVLQKDLHYTIEKDSVNNIIKLK